MEKGTVLDVTEAERLIEDIFNKTAMIYRQGEPWMPRHIHTGALARSLISELERQGCVIVRKETR